VNRYMTAALAVGLLVLPANAQVVRLTPTNLKSLNTAADEDDPCLCIPRRGKTRQLFYISSAGGRPTLMTAELSDRGDWLPGIPVEGPDTEVENRSPCLSADGHDLYFAAKLPFKGPANEASFPANYDILHSVKLENVRKFTAPTPVMAVCTEADELHPWLSADGKELYFSRSTKEGWRILVARRGTDSGPFEKPTSLNELPPGFHHATLTKDGKTMILQGPLANNRWGLFRSKLVRKDKSSEWSAPEELTNLNSTAEEAATGDMSPSLSRDDLRLYFVSDRKGGKGGKDLWVINAPALISGTIRRR
jgi:WD40-like Beta Propeller Repeat